MYVNGEIEMREVHAFFCVLGLIDPRLRPSTLRNANKDPSLIRKRVSNFPIKKKKLSM